MEQKLIAHLDSFELGYWDGEAQEWYALKDLTDEKAAEILSCSPEMVDFIQMNFADLVELIKRDLVDIYIQRSG